MALTIPIVQKVSSFDATDNHTFYFKVIGGDQVVANEIKICKAVDGSVVYQREISMYNYNQIVPSGTLTNGTYYTVTFRTYNALGKHTEWGASVPFYCYSKPQIHLNIDDEDVIHNSTFTAILYYQQDQGELMGSAHISLFDSDKELIKDSGDLFDTDHVAYEFGGLIEDEVYYLKGYVTTVNDTKVETDYISFTVEYDNPIIHTNLDATVDNCNGWVNIRSTLSVIEGHSNFDVEYGDNCAELVSTTFNIEDSYTQWVEWDENFKISKDGFTARFWFIPSRQGKFFVMKSTNGFWIKGNYFLAPNGNDYVQITTSNGGRITSNGIRHETGRDGCFVWVRFDGYTWDVRIEALGTSTTNYNWNTPSNTYRSVWTNVYVKNKTAESYTPPTDITKTMTNDITSVRIGMGIFDHVSITNDTTFLYNKVIPQSMDYHSIIDCDFNNNIDGGSAKIILSNVEKIRIKRKDDISKQWTTVVEKPIKTEQDLHFEFHDHFVPCDTPQTYAIVPVISGDIEGEYITKTVTPKWKKMFVSDGDVTLKFDGNISYDTATNNISIGLVSPIGMRFPVVVQNSELNYLSGSISGSILGVNFDETRKINRRDVVVQTRAIERFLTQGKAFGVTDWNGNVLICRTMASPSHSYNSSYGNGAITLSLSWVQQGQYNDEQSLKDCGLYNVGIVEEVV